MASNDFHFVSNWRVPGTVEDVKAILSDPWDLPQWWPAVYLDAEPIDGANNAVHVITRGWLPYTLHWDLYPAESLSENEMLVDAKGDLEGRGVWTFQQEGPTVAITYDWTVKFNKPILGQLAAVLKPAFAANHRWAMQQGEASLRLELARRQALSEAEQDAIDDPPPPNDDKKFWTAVAVTGVSLLVLKKVFGKKKRA